MKNADRSAEEILQGLVGVEPHKYNGSGVCFRCAVVAMNAHASVQVDKQRERDVEIAKSEAPVTAHSSFSMGYQEACVNIATAITSDGEKGEG